MTSHATNPLNMSGRLEELFEIELQGLELARTVEFRPGLGLEGRLDPGHRPQLSVSVDGTVESTAQAMSARFVRTLFLRLLLLFGRHIEHAAQPRLIRSSFKPAPAESTVTRAAVSVTHSVDAVLSVPAPIILTSIDLDGLAHDVEVRMRTPEPPNSAQPNPAIDMYAISLASQNRVVRFLILYTAVALAALSKSHSGKQERVDELLLWVNPTLLVVPSPRDPRRSETIYTKLRNDLIHAEERGYDPTGAVAAIEAHIRDFQRDVALALSNL